jgi:hypothetical protein
MVIPGRLAVLLSVCAEERFNGGRERQERVVVP